MFKKMLGWTIIITFIGMVVWNATNAESDARNYVGNTDVYEVNGKLVYDN